MRSLRALLLPVCLLTATVAAAKPRLVPIANAAVVAPKSSNPSTPLKIGSQLFFTANDGVHGNELWRSDGTAAGTFMVSDVTQGPAGAAPTIVGAFGNDVLFVSWQTGPNGGLWRSNGTAAGTVKIFTFPPREYPYSDNSVKVFPADSRIYLVISQLPGWSDLWVTDGTATSSLRVGAFPITYSVNSVAVGANGKFYFRATDETVGEQFWVSDGTFLGTHMIQRSTDCPSYTACGPLPERLFRLGGQVLFTTYADGLWKTDGTPQGTAQIAAIAKPFPIASSGTVAFLSSEGGTLWKTDGTSTGTKRAVVTAESIQGPTILDDGRLVYFHYDNNKYGSSIELWRSDGTPAGTARIGLLPVFDYSLLTIPILGAIGNRLLLTGGAEATGNELWLGDADRDSVTFLKDLDARLSSYPSSSNPGAGTALGGRLIFPAADVRGRELWESDGTAEGTKLLFNIAEEPGGGFISGNIRAAADASPVAGATVLLCSGLSCEAPVSTDASGHYRFEGVIPGTYTLLARRAGYTSQVYGGAARVDLGTPVTVTGGYETAGIDFALQPGGTIGGTVTRRLSGLPIAADIYIFDSFGTLLDQVSSSSVTGQFRSASLSIGTYYVEARPSRLDPAAGIVPQRFRGVDCPVTGCQVTVGEPVSVTTGSQINGIDFVLDEYGTISGTVLDSTGAAVEGIDVGFTRTTSSASYYSPGATAKTDANGHYQSPLLNPGNYYVATLGQGFPLVYHPSQVCPNSSTTPCTPTTAVTVSPNANASGINFSIAPVQGRITGLVRDSTGAPFTKVEVVLVDEQTGAYRAQVLTDASGRYYGAIPAGRYYVLALGELYPNVTCGYLGCNKTGATAVTLTDGQTTTLDLRLLSRPVTVTGRLLDAATGAPIPGGQDWIRLYDQNGNYVYSEFGASTSAGNYSISVITRKTSFYVTASIGGYRLTAYPAARLVCPATNCTFPGDAALVSTSALTGRDIRLVRYGTISGTAVDSRTGGPARDVIINFYPTTAGRDSGSASTDAYGRYRWEGGDGAYYVSSSEGQGLLAQRFPDRNCSAGNNCASVTGDIVNAPEGVDVTGIDFHLQERDPTGKISGRVVDAATGIGIAGASLSANNTTNTSRGGTAWTDAQGYYTLENPDWIWGMTSGTYTMHVQAPGSYYVALSGGTHCVDFYACNLYGGTPVTVTGPNTTNINFQMLRLVLTSVSPSAGSVSGGTSVTITGANFTPQATVNIGGRPATITSITPTKIVAVTPVGLEGLAHVTVSLTPSLTSSLTHAYNYTAFPFTDPTLAALTRLKRAHIEELRTAVQYLRNAAALAAFTYTDPTLAGKPVRAIHLLELRTALDQARTALGRTILTYTNTLTPITTRIKAIDVIEIRNGMR